MNLLDTNDECLIGEAVLASFARERGPDAEFTEEEFAARFNAAATEVARCKIGGVMYRMVVRHELVVVFAEDGEVRFRAAEEEDR